MMSVQSISKAELCRRKIEGCYREFGIIETARRTVRELSRLLKGSEVGLDLSLVTKDLAIGAAPKSMSSINRLRDLGFRRVIDLRAERNPSDILINTGDFLVQWIPIYDDWRPKPPEVYQKLEIGIKKVLFSEDGGKLFICCGAGEHRAPLAGILALVTMGYPLEHATAIIIKARPQAELLPAYKTSLVEFLLRAHN
jgi:hypothetical protein